MVLGAGRCGEVLKHDESTVKADICVVRAIEPPDSTKSAIGFQVDPDGRKDSLEVR